MKARCAFLALTALAGFVGPRPAISGAPNPADSLTVTDCVALARTLAPAVRAAGLDATAALSDSFAGAVIARPTLSLVAGSMVAPHGFYDPTITNLGEYEAKLAMDWTLADGGKLGRARRRAGLDYRTARGRAAVETREAGLSAARLAIQALRAEDEVRAKEQTIIWLERLASLVRGGVHAGTRSPSDSMRVDLERDATENALETSWLDARTARLELASLIGRADGDSLAISAGGLPDERSPTEEDSTRLFALIDRQPEIEIASLAEARSRLDRDDARHARAPAVDVTLDAGLAGADLTQAVPPDLRADQPDATFADRLRRDLGASLTVRLRLPVADAKLSSTAKAREVGALAEAVRRVAETARLRRETLALLARWRTAFRRAETAQHTLQRAATNLLRVRSLYSAGATPLLELLDARRVYEESREAMADARAESRALQFEAEDRR